MLLWRLCADVNESLRQRAERLSLRIVGLCFLAPWHSTSATTQFPYLSSTRAPEQSIPGILLAFASLIVMPLLTHATRKVAHGIGRAAMKADATQTEFCT
jgi:divalent metal cation (Fe/Co/Zn/Cd) transporter